MSVAVGPGAYVGVRVTAVAGTGLGYVNANRRWGWPGPNAENRLASWNEAYVRGAVLYWFRKSEAGDLEPGNGLFFVPLEGDLPGIDWKHALDLEIEAQLFVGARIGISPLEIIDFLGGWVGWDPFQDDPDGP
jgi:hypothetical protein